LKAVVVNQGLLLSLVMETREVVSLMLMPAAGRIRGREESRLLFAGVFTVKSMYLDYMNGRTRLLRKYL
jgi:hypothetical protein